MLTCKRVAYTQDIGDGDDAKCYITQILASKLKRIVILFTVLIPELFTVLFLSYVGVGYLLSSDDVEDLLMNSVSVVFILQIDDMARCAFQKDDISNHIDGMKFETNIATTSSSVSENGVIRVPDNATYQTFSSSTSAFICLLISCLCVYPVVYNICYA